MSRKGEVGRGGGAHLWPVRCFFFVQFNFGHKLWRDPSTPQTLHTGDSVSGAREAHCVFKAAAMQCGLIMMY